MLSTEANSTSRIEELAMELKKDYTVVIVTHYMQQAARISNQTAFSCWEIWWSTATLRRCSPNLKTSVPKIILQEGLVNYGDFFQEQPNELKRELTIMGSSYEKIIVPASQAPMDMDDEMFRKVNVIGAQIDVSDAPLKPSV